MNNDTTIIIRRKPKFAIISVRGLGDINDRIKDDNRQKGFAIGCLLKWKSEGRDLLSKINIKHWKERSAIVVGMTFKPAR